MRTASLELHPPRPERGEIERVAGGFEFTEGPVWSPDGALLFSSPNTNAIYRLDTELERVTVFRSKSGYAASTSAATTSPAPTVSPSRPTAC